jgi:hypothetical protein
MENGRERQKRAALDGGRNGKRNVSALRGERRLGRLSKRLGKRDALENPSLPAARPFKLTKTLSFQPNVSPDGKLVAYYYLEDDKRGIGVIAIDGGAVQKKIPIASTGKLRHLRWTPDGKNFAYAQGATSSNVVSTADVR